MAGAALCHLSHSLTLTISLSHYLTPSLSLSLTLTLHVLHQPPFTPSHGLHQPPLVYTNPFGIDMSLLTTPWPLIFQCSSPPLRPEVDPHHRINELLLECKPPLRPCLKFCSQKYDSVALLVFGETVSTVAAFVRALWFRPCLFSSTSCFSFQFLPFLHSLAVIYL